LICHRVGCNRLKSEAITVLARGFIAAFGSDEIKYALLTMCPDAVAMNSVKRVSRGQHNRREHSLIRCGIVAETVSLWR